MGSNTAANLESGRLAVRPVEREMKIVLFGATGNIGQRIVQEALSRGHEVVGVVRDPSKATPPDPRVKLVRADATDESTVVGAVKGADAVVCAISPRPNKQGLPAPSLVKAARGLIGGLTKAHVKRLLIVGGAGTLMVGGQRLLDLPNFPKEYKGEAMAAADALEVYCKEAGALEWTYLSPAAEIGPGRRTGNYRTTLDEFIAAPNGKSEITYEDYAVAVLDELEKPRHVGRRFGVAY
jgi:putative NADH-flavin reductase